MAKSRNRNYDKPWVPKRLREQQPQAKPKSDTKLLIATLDEAAKYGQQAMTKLNSLRFDGGGLIKSYPTNPPLDGQFRFTSKVIDDEWFDLPEYSKRLLQSPAFEQRVFIYANKLARTTTNAALLAVGDIGVDEDSRQAWMVDKIEVLQQSGRQTARATWRSITDANGLPLRMKNVEVLKQYLAERPRFIDPVERLAEQAEPQTSYTPKVNWTPPGLDDFQRIKESFMSVELQVDPEMERLTDSLVKGFAEARAIIEENIVRTLNGAEFGVKVEMDGSKTPIAMIPEQKPQPAPNEIKLEWDQNGRYIGSDWLKGSRFDLAAMAKEFEVAREGTLDINVEGRLKTVRVNARGNMGLDEATGEVFVLTAGGVWKPASIEAVVSKKVSDRMAKGDLAIDAKTGKVLKSRPDGKWEELSPDEVKALGFTGELAEERDEQVKQQQVDRAEKILNEVKQLYGQNWLASGGVWEGPRPEPRQSQRVSQVVNEVIAAPESGRVIVIGEQQYIVSNGGRYLKNLKTGRLIPLEEPEAVQAEENRERYITLNDEEV